MNGSWPVTCCPTHNAACSSICCRIIHPDMSVYLSILEHEALNNVLNFLYKCLNYCETDERECPQSAEE